MASPSFESVSPVIAGPGLWRARSWGRVGAVCGALLGLSSGACAPPEEPPERVGAAAQAALGASYARRIHPGAGQSSPRARFGAAVALTRDELIVGAPGYPSGDRRGRVYVFPRKGLDAEQGYFLEPPDLSDGDAFGSSLAIRGDTLVVGAPGVDSARGAVYIFGRAENGELAQLDRRTALDGEAAEAFGEAVAVADDFVIVGAFREKQDNVANGAVYLLHREVDKWPQVAKLTPPDGATMSSFGTSLDVWNDRLLIGAARGGDYGEGMVWEYTLSDPTAIVAGNIPFLSGSPGDNFGEAVALAAGAAVVGAPLADAADQASAGLAMVFERSGDGFGEPHLLKADEPAAGEWLGKSVAISGNLIVVGAPDTDVSTTNGGSVVAFRRGPDGWSSGVRSLRFRPDEAAPGDTTGVAVAVLDGDVLVGAPYADLPSDGAGVVYLLRFGDDDGTPCAEAADCRSGFCVDQTCCDAACDGEGLSCSAALKGYGADGVCEAAKDPGDGGAGGGGGGFQTGPDAEKHSYYSCSSAAGSRSPAPLVGLFALAVVALSLRRRARQSLP